MTDQSPTFIVHTIDHARAALGAAQARGCSVRLISAPGAAGNLGAQVFLAMITQAAQEFPNAHYQAVLDCADAPGLVMNALRHGAKQIIFTGDAATCDKLRSQANKVGVAIVEPAKTRCELLTQTDLDAACRNWIDRP